MFIFVLLYTSIYLMLTERYKASLIAMLPAFSICFLVAGLQYKVGTDYLNYIDIYKDESRQWYYFMRGEYLFFSVNKVLNWFGFPAQSLFLTISFIQSIVIFSYFKKLKKRGFIIWLFFLVFFTVTNIYNNQLNGLRQYVVITLMPLLSIYLFDRKYLKFFIGLLVASFFHNTAWLYLLLVPILVLRKWIKNNILFCFFFSALFYLLFGSFIVEVAGLLLPGYSHYLSTEYADGRSIEMFLTKIYYLPLIFYFIYCYKRCKTKRDTYFDFAISVFVVTYWFFLLALSLGIATRVYYYVIFFYAFPIYYILESFLRRGKAIRLVFVMFYIVAPYIIKVTVLSKNEFSYQSIIFN